jgi:hypothetical protein
MPPGLSFCPLPGWRHPLVVLGGKTDTISTRSLVTIALLAGANGVGIHVQGDYIRPMGRQLNGGWCHMTLSPTDMLAIQSALDRYERRFPNRPSPTAAEALAWRSGTPWDRLSIWWNAAAMPRIRPAWFPKRAPVR